MYVLRVGKKSITLTQNKGQDPSIFVVNVICRHVKSYSKPMKIKMSNVKIVKFSSLYEKTLNGEISIVEEKNS